MMVRMLRVTLAVALCLGAVACDTQREARRRIEDTVTQTSDLTDRARTPAPVARTGNILFSDRIWLARDSFLSPHGDPFPTSLEQADSIVFNTLGRPISLEEVGEELRRQTGLPVIVEQGAQAFASVDFQGPMSTFLEQVSSAFGSSYEFRRGRLRLIRQETRTFTIAALPLSSSVTSTLDTQAPSVGGGDSDGIPGLNMDQVTANEISIQIWAELTDNLAVLLNDQTLGTFAASPSTGSITVSAPPNVMRQVETYIEEINRRLTQQVAVSVKVFEISLDDEFELGVDFDLVLNDALSSLGVDVAGTLAQGPFTTAVAPAGPLTASITSAGGFSGTQIAVQALRRIGDVSLMNEASVTTINGQSAPISVAVNRGFLRSSEITTTTTDGVVVQEASLEPGSVTSGLNAQVLPRVLEDGRIVLQFGTSITQLLSLEAFTSGTSEIQVPNLSARNFMQQVILRSGDAFVVAGFREEQARTVSEETPGFGWLFGGRDASATATRMLAVVITPRLLSSRRGG